MLLQAAGIQAPSITINGHSVLQNTALSASGANGGSVTIAAAGSVVSGAPIEAKGGSGAGGSLSITAGQAVVQSAGALLDVSGASAGGSISVQAGKSLFTSSTASALGTGAGAKGGTIEFSAPTVHLAAAQLDASGSGGGGAVRVGGGFQGQALSLGGANASSTTVTAASSLKADATDLGNGGQVVVWSEQSTSFRGSVSAKGGPNGGDGGVLEVSGKEQLLFGGMGDASAPKGTPGSLLLDPKNIVIAADAIGYDVTQLVDPNPGISDNFAQEVTVLSSGNIVATDPFDDAFGIDAGATYLFNGSTGALLSTLSGTLPNNQVGSGGVTALTNGNYLIYSPLWTGNSLTSQLGAVTWGSGTSGIIGAVSSSNSLVGSQAFDQVGIGRITEVGSGNYVVRSYRWANGTATNAGAVTWGSGTSGISGVVSAANSLVGSATGDLVGSGDLAVLSNGNYVVASPQWGNTGSGALGAVTWGSGSSGIIGAVSSTNSLVGSSFGDEMGSGGVIALTNGNYVVISPNYTIPAPLITTAFFPSKPRAGSVAQFDGSTGLIFSGLVGSQAEDQVGSGGITELSNGNYVVASPKWANSAGSSLGAVTWVDPLAGGNQSVNSSNSLIGSSFGDSVGSGGVTAVNNGNYVISSPDWDNSGVFNAGAVTWVNGSSAASGTPSSANSLVGSSPNDRVGGSGITVLTNGNYVVESSSWSGSTLTSQLGAVTWGSGTTGISGVVSSGNSLVGSTIFDIVGNAGITTLTNGNYVVASSFWDNGTAMDAGAVTWGNGSLGSSGVVSGINSLVGTSTNDAVGSDGVTALINNGNYVVASSSWDNGTNVNAGAVTWANGSSGITGAVSSSNSLVGSTSADQVGIGGITALANGNFVVSSFYWSNTAASSSPSSEGAVTWGNGNSGITGVVTSSNSLVGLQANGYYGRVSICSDGCFYISGISALSGDRFVINSNSYGTGEGLLQIATANALTNPFNFSNSPGSDVGISPALITATANTGTAVVLQANNDITLRPGSDIVIDNPGGTSGSAPGGNLTLQAGRSIDLQSSIRTDGANLTLIANDPAAISTFRDAGLATVTMAAGTSIDLNTNTAGAAAGALYLSQFSSTLGVPPSAGVVSLTDITAGLITVDARDGLSLNGTLNALSNSPLTGLPNAGRSLVLYAGAGSFLNPGGSSALNSPNGWLVYADSRSTDANLLNYDFKQYGKTFDDTTPIAAAGKGVIYGFTPAPLTVSLVNASTKNYDSNVDAPISAGNYLVSGAIDGDTVQLNNPVLGAYTTAGTGVGVKDVGTGKTVSVAGVALAPTQIVYGYSLASSTATGVIGGITARPLTATSINSGNSTYGSPLSPGAVNLSNIVGTELVTASASVNTGALSTSGNPIFGAYTQSASATLSGADANNYSFSGFTTTTPNYNINKLALSGAAIAASSSIYGSALVPGAVSFSNIVGLDAVGSSAFVNTAALSTSNNPVFGSYTQSASALSGADAANYSFLGFTTATPNYSIGKLALAGPAIAAGTSIYGSALAPGVVSFSNIVGLDAVGSSAAVNTGALSISNNPVFGSYTQSASALSGADAANYSFLGFTTATPNYSISKLALAGPAIAAGTSIYGSALAPGVVSFSNIVGLDAVGSSAAVNTSTLSTSGNPIFGAYTQSASATLSGADAANYSFSGFTTATPNYNINKLALSGAAIAASSSIYGSALVPGAVSFSNIIGLDAVGSSAAVNTSTLSTSGNPIFGAYTQSASATLSGADANNYSFSGFTTTTPNYNINKLALSGAAIAASSSIYGSALAPGAVSFSNIIGLDAVGSSAAVNTSTLSTSGNPIFGAYTQSASATLSGADTNNYSFSGFATTTPNYNINQLALSGASVIAENKVYNGRTAATLSDTSLGGRLPGDVVVLNSGASTFSDPNVGTGKTVTVSGAGISGTDAANYSLTSVPTTLSADISIRPVATWVASTAGNWSDSANWDALPSAANVASVRIPVGSGALTYDAAAGSTTLQSLFNDQSLNLTGGSLAVSGATTVGTGASLGLNGGSFSTASLLNRGLVNGSGPLALNGSYTESGGSLGTGFSSVSITQTSGDLNLRGSAPLGR
ncbi:YDG domain-containing protein [Cyanobium sp. ATX-6F1]|uniref:YDG domain-containing protein n=1 Tax=Cyanobium sp. ATX-6F1 TaxID=3137388 RepID=UPI0039BDE25C